MWPFVLSPRSCSFFFSPHPPRFHPPLSPHHASSTLKVPFLYGFMERFLISPFPASYSLLTKFSRDDFIKSARNDWYIEDITCPRVDMNFIFSWSTRYLTRSLCSLVRYRVDHEKIKFISISGHVIFCLLYKHQWNTKWAFPRKRQIFTREENMLSSHVKRSPSLWLHNKSRLWVK